MRGKIYIGILLFIAGQAVFGASPDSAGIFTPDKNVERLAQEYDRIYFPLFIQSLNDISKSKNQLIIQFFPSREKSDPSPDTILQNKAPGSLVEVVYYKQGVTEKGFVIAYPVPWSAPGNHDPSWNLWFQSLTWLEVYLGSNNPDSVFAAYRVIHDWILRHTQYPDRDEKYAFADHPSAMRMWVLQKAYHKNNQPGFHQAGLENLLLMSLLSHLFYIVSLEKYTSWHNHGVISDQYLIKTLKDLPGFTLQQQFINLAFQRIFEQFRYAFNVEGIHKEHSPCYHLFVNRLMGEVLEMGSEIKYPIPRDITELQSMTDHYSNMVGNLAGFAKIGDCQSNKYNPYSYTKTNDLFRVYPRSGWVYARHQKNQVTLIAQSDFYSFGHYHQDETSFVLNASGHDLVIDPGLYSYNRKLKLEGYMRSPFSHNLMVADSLDFNPNLEQTGLSGITRYYIRNKRKQNCGAFEMTHPHYEKEDIRIWRQLVFTPDNMIIIKDIATALDTHLFSQLFHLAPNAVIAKSDSTCLVTWPDHPYCLEFTSNADEYEIAEGGENPLQGWYFPEFNKAWPSKVLILKKKGKGIIVETKIKIYAAHEIARKPGKEEKDADLLFRKLESLERNQLTHCPIPEKWRPARK